MEKEASNTFHKHNPTEDNQVENFLTAFEKGERGSALRLLDEEEVFIVSAAYLQNMRERQDRLFQQYEEQSEAMEEIRGERDKLLKGLYAIYTAFGFVIEAIKKASKAEKPMKGTKMIKPVLQLFGFKQVDTQACNIIVASIVAIQKNLKKITKNFPTMGDDLMPGLRILEKHGIIPPIEIELKDKQNDKEEEE